jgi:hypothetical protein
LGPFVDQENLTKRLVFSAWSATPTAVASLLSYEAERQLFHEARAEGAIGYGDGRRRLEYRLDGGRPAAMTTLALFWPHPGLAARLDPLAIARDHRGQVATIDHVHAESIDRVRAMLPARLVDADHRGEASPAQAYLQLPDALPARLTEVELARGLAGTAGGETSARAEGDTDVGRGLDGHVAAARRAAVMVATAARTPDDLVDDLAMLGAHGPGNIAWRALDRLVTPTDAVTVEGHWIAAAVLASGLTTRTSRSGARCWNTAPTAVYRSQWTNTSTTYVSTRSPEPSTTHCCWTSPGPPEQR